jgi:hypothetical protein
VLVENCRHTAVTLILLLRYEDALPTTAIAALDRFRDW